MRTPPRARRPALLLLAAATAAAGCGKLLDERYRGEPLATLSGFVASAQGPQAGPVIVSLQWLNPSESALFFVERPLLPPLEGAIETTCVSDTTVGGGCDGTPTSGARSCRVVNPLAAGLEQPVPYELGWGGALRLRLHELPPAAARYDLRRQGGQGTVALATIVATADEERDGRVRQGTPEHPPVAAVAGSVPRFPAEGAAGSPAVRRSFYLAFLDGQPDLGRVALATRLDRPFAPRAGYGLWVKEELLDPRGRVVSASLRAAPGGGLEETITLAPYLGAEQQVAWCTAWTTEVAWQASLFASAALDWCLPGGLVASWEQTEAVGPCQLRTLRYAADFSCTATPPPWEPGACP